MIRFDEVPIGSKFNLENGRPARKVEEFYYYDEEEDLIRANCISTDGGFRWYCRPDEMVELVEKCANCKYLSHDKDCKQLDSYCIKLSNCINPEGGHETIDKDPGTFWCSEGELE